MASRYIKGLGKRHSPARNALARQIMTVREIERKNRDLAREAISSVFAKGEWRGMKVASKGKPFRFWGAEHRARRFFAGESRLEKRIPMHLAEVIRKKGKARIMDIGSGAGQYWKYILRMFGPEKIDLHTLNVSNYTMEFVPTEAGKQHVGALETKNLKKLGVKRNDLVFASYVIGHTKTNFNENVSKAAKLVSKGGKLVLVFGHKEIQGDLTEQGLKKTLGPDFKMDFFASGPKRKTFNSILVATRIR